MIEDFDAQIVAKQQEIADLRSQKRRANAAELRTQIRAQMTPEALKADSVLDETYTRLFATDDGKVVLADLAQSRPVVADMINERMDRAAKGTIDVTAFANK